MRCSKKLLEAQEKYFRQRERLREKRQRNSSSRGVSISHESCPASDGPGNRELTGMKPAAGVYLMGEK